MDDECDSPLDLPPSVGSPLPRRRATPTLASGRRDYFRSVARTPSPILAAGESVLPIVHPYRLQSSAERFYARRLSDGAAAFARPRAGSVGNATGATVSAAKQPAGRHSVSHLSINLEKLFASTSSEKSSRRHSVTHLSSPRSKLAALPKQVRKLTGALRASKSNLPQASQQTETTASNETKQQHSDNEDKIKNLKRLASGKLISRKLARLTPIGSDWLHLALLGIVMAILSFTVDAIVSLLLSTRLSIFTGMLSSNLLFQFIGWSSMPILLVTISSLFVHVCSPTAVGSGIPEMKTILRGVVLNEYLTFRTLVGKLVGLTFTLGSGLPLGKEGPFVHIASIVATLLGKLTASFHGIYENESRASELLSAACAVGVAATFYAPIGGVLFSIEVTTVYFAVRNYWRGFFAACCGATVWRLLDFWLKNDGKLNNTMCVCSLFVALTY